MRIKCLVLIGLIAGVSTLALPKAGRLILHAFKDLGRARFTAVGASRTMIGYLTATWVSRQGRYDCEARSIDAEDEFTGQAR